MNASGYVTGDLVRFFDAACRAAGTRGIKTFVVTASPIRSRGCADVGTRAAEGADIVIALSSPSKFSLRRLARLLDHELLHVRGDDHKDMEHEDLYSLGPVPAWARGLKLRYRGRAPSQIP